LGLPCVVTDVVFWGLPWVAEAVFGLELFGALGAGPFCPFAITGTALSESIATMLTKRLRTRMTPPRTAQGATGVPPIQRCRSVSYGEKRCANENPITDLAGVYTISHRHS